MRTVRTIKNVDEDTWNELKFISKRNKMHMGKTIKLMINEYKNRNKFWDNVLNNKKILSDKEAEDMIESAKEIRKEKGFRK